MTNSQTMLTPEMKAQFEENGYLVLPGFLKPEEVERLRSTSKAHLAEHAVFVDGGTTQMDAFRHIPGLRWLLTDARVLEAFRYFCGPNLEYCHHSDVHMNKFTGWHKDNHGHDDWRLEPDGTQFGVYKMAFYLQDHSKGPTALFVRKGSHRTADVHTGEIVELRPSVGDAVFFDTRISHKGEEKSAFGKVFSKISPSRALTTSVLQALRQLSGKEEKMSIFFTYGWPNAFTDEHVGITIDRQLQQSGEATYALPNDLARQLTDAGIIARSLARSRKTAPTA
jgi:hypothetical protein